MKWPGAIACLLLVSATTCWAQQTVEEQNNETQKAEDMPGMDMGHPQGTPTAKHQSMDMSMPMEPQNFVQEILLHESSGTSAQPNSTPVPMLMGKGGGWGLMFHANLFVLDEQQSGPRGTDKFFSTNWFMGMAQRKFGRGTFTGRAMLSLEPATVTSRQYPLLFQQGETAFGKPIADGQHPHDLFMELAVLYDYPIGANSLLSIYVAPVGDPAIGPLAYPHRASASEDPFAPLGHHQQDSTHISDDVVTAGFAHRVARIEASGFRGREPDEFRWDLDQGPIDSWSVRLTVQPGKNWSSQYSYGRIASPEQLSPEENQERMTASVMYNRPLHNGNWANTIVWGHTRSLGNNFSFDSYLVESTLNLRVRNYIWTRIESAERSNELIAGKNPLPANFEEKPIGQVQAYTLGYDRDFHVVRRLDSALGGQFTTYGVSRTLQPVYGSRPFSFALFFRFRPDSREAQ